MSSFLNGGGLFLYPTLAFGLLQLAAATARVFEPRRGALSTFVLLGVATVGCGAAGLSLGAVTTFVSAARLPPAQQYPVALAGLADSLGPFALALGLVVLSTLVLAAGALRAALAAGPERR